MSIEIQAASIQGIDAVPIRVEVDLLRRLPRVCIVGLAANAVQESAERVRSAMIAAGEEFPRQRVVINLAPADVRKEGTSFDLAMAVGILVADGRVPLEAARGVLWGGELSLSGELRPVRGALSLALLARERGWTLVLPPGNASLAAQVPGAQVREAAHLAQVLAWMRGEQPLDAPRPSLTVAPRDLVDLAEVRGQAVARRALEIAAAGAHNLLMVGPPGCGKSMLARRLPTILPPLTFDEALETTRIYAAAGLCADDPDLRHERPFRAPHHTVSVAGLIGDRRLRPGEVSLAHHGVLFLDEAAEFPRAALEVLRTPLEDGRVRLVRAEGAVDYPARISLVLATNPCPCGRRGSNAPCACTDHDVARYRRRLSGPLLDRVDLHVTLEPVPPSVLLGGRLGEPSDTVRERVIAARRFARARGQDVPNAHLAAADVERRCTLAADVRRALRDDADRLGLSGRATTRVLRVARTLADLEGAEAVGIGHVGEALGFRPTSDLD